MNYTFEELNLFGIEINENDNLDEKAKEIRDIEMGYLKNMVCKIAQIIERNKFEYAPVLISMNDIYRDVFEVWDDEIKKIKKINSKSKTRIVERGMDLVIFHIVEMLSNLKLTKTDSGSYYSDVPFYHIEYDAEYVELGVSESMIDNIEKRVKELNKGKSTQ